MMQGNSFENLRKLRNRLRKMRIEKFKILKSNMRDDFGRKENPICG